VKVHSHKAILTISLVSLVAVLCFALLLSSAPAIATVVSVTAMLTPTPTVTPTPSVTPKAISPLLPPPTPPAALGQQGSNVWTTGGPYGININALAIDPSRPNIVYAGGDSGLFKTTNSGASWEEVKSGETIYALAIDPATPSTIYAGGCAGVFKSTDDGASWTLINAGLTTTDVRSLTVDPATPNTIYAGTYGGGVFKSTDGGANWVAKSAGLTNMYVHALALDPNNPSIIYAATDAGIFKTTDGAETWAAANTGLKVTSYYAVIVDPVASNVVYAASLYNPYYAGVYRSSDGGASWEIANSGIVGADAKTLAIASNVLYVGTDGGVFRSVDGGLRWRGILPDLPLSTAVRCLAVDGSDPPTIYAGMYDWQEPANRGVWQCTLTSLPPTSVLPSDPPKGVVIVGPIDAPINEATQAAIEGHGAQGSSDGELRHGGDPPLSPRCDLGKHKRQPFRSQHRHLLRPRLRI